MKERLAIVGTGVAGLGCAHFLQRDFDLTLFERNRYAGGHTNTVTAYEDDRPVPIDTGFMVFNKVTYPNLCRLFRQLDVPVMPTDMSFSVQHAESGIEWMGSSLNTLFGQRRNLARPRFWRMLLQIGRFNREAVEALDDPRWDDVSLRDYTAARRYGHDFFDLYLVPMSAAVWSAPPEMMEKFPVKTLLRFWHNHGFLGMHTQHPWWTVRGGAKTYVEKLTRPFRERIHLGDPALAVVRSGDGARVITENGAQEFDKVILAAHADESLALLADPTEEERRLLSPFEYQPNSATLHTYTGFMPRSRRCWASWNYRVAQRADRRVEATTHYWMNSLQKVSDRHQYFVSLNSDDDIPAEAVVRKIQYTHPRFNVETARVQPHLPTLNRCGAGRNTFFAGSYFRYGFHEDAFASAVAASQAILDRDPWDEASPAVVRGAGGRGSPGRTATATAGA
jgi:predicted NAD/FAD-binding protein